MRIISTEYRTGACLTVQTGPAKVSVRSSSSMRKTISPGARSRMDRFFDQIDWDLGAEERELRRKLKKQRRKERRRLKRLLKRKDEAKNGNRASGCPIIDLLGGNGGAI